MNKIDLNPKTNVYALATYQVLGWIGGITAVSAVFTAGVWFAPVATLVLFVAAAACSLIGMAIMALAEEHKGQKRTHDAAHGNGYSSKYCRWCKHNA